MLKVYIIKKYTPVFNDTASSVVLPGEDGELTILPFHSSLIVRLKLGLIKVDGEEIFLLDGVGMVLNDEVYAIIE